jgi:dTDP-glucose pyrophosphorylase
MWCVIPAAGRATRLAACTGGQPKALIPIGGRPLIEHLLDRLGPRVTDVCLVCSPGNRETIEARLGRCAGPARLHYEVQPRPLGVADAVGHAMARVDGAFLVVMGDCYFDTSLADFVDRWSTTGAEGAVLTEPADEAGGQPMGLVETSGGFVRRIYKSSWTGQTEWRVSGAFLFPESFGAALADLSPSGSGELELEDVATRLMGGGATFAAVPYGGWRRNINTPGDLAAVRGRLAGG